MVACSTSTAGDTGGAGSATAAASPRRNPESADRRWRARGRCRTAPAAARHPVAFGVSSRLAALACRAPAGSWASTCVIAAGHVRCRSRAPRHAGRDAQQRAHDSRPRGLEDGWLPCAIGAAHPSRPVDADGLGRLTGVGEHQHAAIDLRRSAGLGGCSRRPAPARCPAPGWTTSAAVASAMTAGRRLAAARRQALSAPTRRDAASTDA